jgi:hypothetical protein
MKLPASRIGGITEGQLLKLVPQRRFRPSRAGMRAPSHCWNAAIWPIYATDMAANVTVTVMTDGKTGWMEDRAGDRAAVWQRALPRHGAPAHHLPVRLRAMMDGSTVHHCNRSPLAFLNSPRILQPSAPTPSLGRVPQGPPEWDQASPRPPSAHFSRILIA